MRKSFFAILIVGLFLLVGCTNSGITTKSGLIEQSAEYSKTIKKQYQLLSRLKKELDASVAHYDNLTPDTSLEELNVSLEARDDTVTALTKLNDNEKKANTTFQKTVKQNNSHFPIGALRQVTQSQEIAFLDRDTFMNYLTKTKDAEKKVSDLFKNGEPDKEELRAAVESTTQYYSALIQQIEIWQVNTNRVQNDAKNLVNALK